MAGAWSLVGPDQIEQRAASRGVLVELAVFVEAVERRRIWHPLVEFANRLAQTHFLSLLCRGYVRRSFSAGHISIHSPIVRLRLTPQQAPKSVVLRHLS